MNAITIQRDMDGHFVITAPGTNSIMFEQSGNAMAMISREITQLTPSQQETFTPIPERLDKLEKLVHDIAKEMAGDTENVLLRIQLLKSDGERNGTVARNLRAEFKGVTVERDAGGKICGIACDPKQARPEFLEGLMWQGPDSKTSIPSAAPENENWWDALIKKAGERWEFVMSTREEILEAFMAHYGCKPDEVEQVEVQHKPDMIGKPLTTWFVRKKQRDRVSGYAYIDGEDKAIPIPEFSPMPFSDAISDAIKLKDARALTRAAKNEFALQELRRLWDQGTTRRGVGIAFNMKTTDRITGLLSTLPVSQEPPSIAHGGESVFTSARIGQVCCVCDWTNIGCLNLGDPSKSEWVCHGCIKREHDRQYLFPELLEAAWGIIANATSGDWGKATKEWRDAAEKWRNKYHSAIRAEKVTTPGLDPISREKLLTDEARALRSLLTETQDELKRNQGYVVELTKERNDFRGQLETIRNIFA